MIIAWIITCLGLMILPGPDMALVTKQSLSGGWRAGRSVLLGIYLSFALYSVAILLGIIPLLNGWPAFFIVARILGGAYLIYLGVRGIADARGREIEGSRAEGRGLIASGFISNALNAKQYLFLFLLLPSFLPSSPSWQDSLLLLVILLVVSLLFWAVWIFAISQLREKMAHHHRIIETISSVVLIVVGALLIVGVI